MGDNTYPATIAIRFVAVGRLQHQASHAKNLFVEDRLLRAADSALIQSLGDRHYPDLPDCVAESDIALAVVAIKSETSGLVGLLVVAGEKLIMRAIANTRRTVRRRHDLRCAKPLEGLQARDRRTEVEDRLDFRALSERASRLHKEVLRRRVQGQDDREIAAALKLQHKHVPVLAHRAIISVRKMLAKSPIRSAVAAS